MGGGIKSKFRFPIPGRSSKKQQAPTASAPGPLSKAQRILGADGINIGSSRLAVDPGRSWETGSTGGISISISETSASDIGIEQEDEKKALWEEESAIIPRHNRSAHGPTQRGPRGPVTNRSAFTIQNESRDNLTTISTRGRRLSSSTIDTHYDSAKMPLAISQQTSNSAMAKGLPTKVNELLDMDGTLAGPQMEKKKKKPARLDLSRLRPKGYKERNRNALNVGPVLGNNYVMRSPSFMSQTPQSPPTLPNAVTEGRQVTPRKLTKQHETARLSPRSKGITEASGLQQLYHHYEQMSFQNEDTSQEKAGRKDRPTSSERDSDGQRPVSSFTHSLLAPLPLQLPRGQDPDWNHSRNDSHDSRVTASIADSSGGLQVHSVSQNDYAGSISSRHTRTSKASPSSKSMLGSDRLQSSVLSLSDSSDDETIESTPPAPLSYREGVTHDVSPENSDPSKGQQNLGHLHGTTSPRKFMPSLNQVDENLAVRSASRIQNIRSPSNNTLRSSHSSMSTVTPGYLPPSAPDSRLSSRSIETLDTIGSPYQPGYGVQQARAVAFVPLASTVEAVSKVSMSEAVHHMDKVLQRQDSTATSHVSRSSDQPTPPLSPNSVEFYVKSRESLQRDAMTSGSSEANARLMAVTRQEEMLLAALRQKRAKMRETVISEVEEDGKGRTNYPSQGGLGNAKRLDTLSGKPAGSRPAIPKHVNPTATAWPKRASSLFIGGSRENLHHAGRQNGLHNESRDVNLPSTAGRSGANERTSTSATGSTTSATYDSRSDQNLLYFDQPTDSTNTAESSVDFSDDYTVDSDGEDLIANERRTSRMQARRDSASSAARGPRTGSEGSRRGSSSHSSRRRADSTAANSLNPSLKGYRLQDVPEVEILQEPDEDVDADDSDDDRIGEFPRPPMPPPSWPLPPRPEKSAAKPNSPATSTDFLHPSSAMQQAQQTRPLEHKTRHLRGKRSMVRLSAVGRVNGPMPHWGDED